jgi:hypothetical protein
LPYHWDYIIVFNNEKVAKLSVTADGEMHRKVISNWLIILQRNVKQIRKQDSSSFERYLNASGNKKILDLCRSAKFQNFSILALPFCIFVWLYMRSLYSRIISMSASAVCCWSITRSTSIDNKNQPWYSQFKKAGDAIGQRLLQFALDYRGDRLFSIWRHWVGNLIFVLFYYDSNAKRTKYQQISKVSVYSPL